MADLPVPPPPLPPSLIPGAPILGATLRERHSKPLSWREKSQIVKNLLGKCHFHRVRKAIEAAVEASSNLKSFLNDRQSNRQNYSRISSFFEPRASSGVSVPAILRYNRRSKILEPKPGLHCIISSTAITRSGLRITEWNSHVKNVILRYGGRNCIVLPPSSPLLPKHHPSIAKINLFQPTSSHLTTVANSTHQPIYHNIQSPFSPPPSPSQGANRAKFDMLDASVMGRKIVKEERKSGGEKSKGDGFEQKRTLEAVEKARKMALLEKREAGAFLSPPHSRSKVSVIEMKKMWELKGASTAANARAETPRHRETKGSLLRSHTSTNTQKMERIKWIGVKVTLKAQDHGIWVPKKLLKRIPSTLKKGPRPPPNVQSAVSILIERIRCMTKSDAYRRLTQDDRPWVRDKFVEELLGIAKNPNLKLLLSNLYGAALLLRQEIEGNDVYEASSETKPRTVAGAMRQAVTGEPALSCLQRAWMAAGDMHEILNHERMKILSWCRKSRRSLVPRSSGPLYKPVFAGYRAPSDTVLDVKATPSATTVDATTPPRLSSNKRKTSTTSGSRAAPIMSAV
ncbi:hypothetical protein AAMO2058_001072300 [Amorphochlora amoebiformis]